MDTQDGSDLPGWAEILEDRLGEHVSFESLAKFHNDLWTALDIELDQILGS